MLSNALIWIMCQIINFINNGDGLIPGDFDEPSHKRAGMGISQRDLLEVWKNVEISLESWHGLLPSSFEPCARRPVALSSLVPGLEDTPDDRTMDLVAFTVPMCAVTVQTYHMGRILLLINMPQESTAIRSSVTVRLHSYRNVEREVVWHAKEICGISLAGLPAAIRSHTVQPLFVAGQCFQAPAERQMVVNLLRAVEDTIGWGTEYRVNDLIRQWSSCSDTTFAL